MDQWEENRFIGFVIGVIVCFGLLLFNHLFK